MEVQTLELDRAKARELYRDYKRHQHYSTPIDDEIRRTYQKIAQGKVVIRALESIAAAGLGADGFPKLAIARATLERIELELYPDGHASMFRQRWERTSRYRMDFAEGTFSGVHPLTERWRSSHTAEAIVPTVPINLRPKRGLDNYHVLFEAEWSRTVPKDPMLLRRLGKGDLWLVVAAWDLTAVEQAALQARVVAH